MFVAIIVENFVPNSVESIVQAPSSSLARYRRKFKMFCVCDRRDFYPALVWNRLKSIVRIIFWIVTVRFEKTFNYVVCGHVFSDIQNSGCTT